MVTFLTAHLGFPIPSPALLEKIGTRFRREVKAFAAEHDVPILHLKKPDRTRFDDRKLDHVRPYLDRAERARQWGVVAIVAAQEFQWVFTATKKSGAQGGVLFSWAKTERRVSCYYFYVMDREFGPGFIKICTYFPYPAKVWLNGHEWAKRQARRARPLLREDNRRAHGRQGADDLRRLLGPDRDDDGGRGFAVKHQGPTDVARAGRRKERKLLLFLQVEV